MGKKVCQSSLKISKYHSHQGKKQLDSLIKVLRPKVYITDSSSFKRLVQELTGNGNTPTAVSSSPPPAVINPKAVDKISIIDIEDHGDDHHPSESSIEASSDVSLDSFDELCNYQVSSPPEELGQAYYSQIYLHDPQASETTSSEYLLMGQQEELLAYQDLDSWLLDIEPFPPYSTYNLQIQQEVSIYDYELSGLI